MLKRFPKDETMVNVKKTKDILEDEEYEKIIDIVKKYDKYISESGILKKCFKEPISDSERKCLRKRLNLLVRENVFACKTRECIVKEIHYTPNKKFSQKEVFAFIFEDYTKKKQKYYYYPKRTNMMVIRLKKMYDDIENHNSLVSEEDMAQINRNIINFSILFSACESGYCLAKYNLEHEKLLEKNPQLAAILKEEIKIESNTPALFNILNRLVNGDKIMKFSFISNEGYMQLMKKSIDEINAMFLTLHKYYNSQFLAKKYLSDLEGSSVSVWYIVPKEDMPSQNLDISQFNLREKTDPLSRLSAFFRKLSGPQHN